MQHVIRLWKSGRTRRFAAGCGVLIGLLLVYGVWSFLTAELSGQQVTETDTTPLADLARVATATPAAPLTEAPGEPLENRLRALVKEKTWEAKHLRQLLKTTQEKRLLQALAQRRENESMYLQEFLEKARERRQAETERLRAFAEGRTREEKHLRQFLDEK